MGSVKYAEGDWFAIPLREGGYGVGLLARANRNGVLLGYFFGPAMSAIPSLDDVVMLNPSQAVLVGHFGHLGLKGGTWPIVGKSPQWDRLGWPSPMFFRFEELSGRWFRVFYDDDDPNRVVREEQVSAAAAQGLPQDGLMGAGFVEIQLGRLLGAHVTFADAD